MDENVLQRLMALQAQPQGWSLPVPQFNVQSSPHQKTATPRFGGELNVPAFGGTVGLSGDYQAQQFGPADWSAMMRYRREF
jgi:hypothetical protein